MDQTTHEVRLASWKAIIEQCQARPEGQSAKQWLAENNVSEKQYYYWLRCARRSVLGENGAATTDSKPLPAASFVEIPAREVFPSNGGNAVTIRTRNATIKISSAVSEALLLELVKAVAHAL